MAQLDSETLFDLVAHHRRRHVIECLRERRAMTLADVVDAVAVREYEHPVEDILPKGLKGVHLTPSHAHIPKLESADIVENVRARDTVVSGEALERAAGLLVAVAEEPRSVV